MGLTDKYYGNENILLQPCMSKVDDLYNLAHNSERQNYVTIIYFKQNLRIQFNLGKKYKMVICNDTMSVYVQSQLKFYC